MEPKKTLAVGGRPWMLMDAPETEKGAEAPFLCVLWISIDVHGTKSLERVMGIVKRIQQID